MKTISSKISQISKLLGGLALVVVAQGALAVSSWNSGTLTSTCSGSGGEFGFRNNADTGSTTYSVLTGNAANNNVVTNGANCAAQGSGLTASPTASLSAFSTASGTTAANATAGTSFAAAGVANWGGAGYGTLNKLEKDVTGPHATDNAFGVEATLISFGSKVSLTGVKVGWNGTDNSGETSGVYGDSDLSLLAWTGSSGPAGIAGQSIAQLLTAGWQLVGNYLNVGSITSPTNTATVSSAIYSSYWLVSAYSSSYGTAMNGVSGNDNNIDAFKLFSVAGKSCNGVGETVTGATCGTTSKVPEPGSLALLGAGLLGFMATRRRKPAALAA